ncbi:hypothetical protein BHM03_00029260 [Ensete ventricosum]|nr:hypothetical protein BHM03_00029260 [Ensete ventricosum]
MFRSIFHAPSPKFKILAIPNVLAHEKSYEHGFVKKCDGHKVCTKSFAKSSFDWFFVHRLEKILVIPNVLANGNQFKILVIPNVLAQGKLYEHGFMKKNDDQKLRAKSHAKLSFDRFFTHHL